MNKSNYILLCLVMLSASLSAQEFAYVTDSLQLRVYSSASADSELLQTIDSGDSVEIFASEGGFTQVSTYDGTVGWVKSAFLVEDPPAKLLYFSLSEKNKELETELEQLKNENESTRVTPTSETTSAQVEDLQKELYSLQENNQKLQQQLDDQIIHPTGLSSVAPQDLNPIQILRPNLTKWWIGAVVGFLLAGFLFGLKFSSWQMKKRLHGFRF